MLPFTIWIYYLSSQCFTCHVPALEEPIRSIFLASRNFCTMRLIFLVLMCSLELNIFAVILGFSSIKSMNTFTNNLVVLCINYGHSSSSIHQSTVLLPIGFRQCSIVMREHHERKDRLFYRDVLFCLMVLIPVGDSAVLPVIFCDPAGCHDSIRKSG